MDDDAFVLCDELDEAVQAEIDRQVLEDLRRRGADL